MRKIRVGIFGGTFNPPHNGHVAAAECFLKEMSLDELKIIPAYIPPHKAYESTVTCEERLEMCTLAFSGIKNIAVSDIEIQRGGRSYTYLTLEELSRDDIELFLLCGTDMILSMDTWKNPQIIFNLAKICYVRRESDVDKSSELKNKCDEYRRVFGATIYEIPNSIIEISSTEIRKSPDVAKQNLPPKVLEYINQKGLYQ